jgi:hypothetical protein
MMIKDLYDSALHSLRLLGELGLRLLDANKQRRVAYRDWPNQRHLLQRCTQAPPRKPQSAVTAKIKPSDIRHSGKLAIQILD